MSNIVVRRIRFIWLYF